MTSALGLAHAIRREVGGKSYVTAPYQWGTVSAVHTSPDTVDLYLDGSSVLTPSIRYLDSYVPTVGDVVLVGRYKADRVVFGTLANGATPITTLQADVTTNTGDITTLESQVANLSGAATTYTPTLTASTTNPSGYTAEGRYLQVGHFVWYWFFITLGSAVGSGYYKVSTPVVANSNIQNVGVIGSGTGGVSESGFTVVQGQWFIYVGSVLLLRVATSATQIANVTNTVPFTLSSGSTLAGTVVYEAA